MKAEEQGLLLACTVCAFMGAVLAGIAAGVLLSGDLAREFDISMVESDVAVLQVWIEALYDLVLERCKP